MNKEAKYLRVTLHDNDFIFELESVGELLQDLFIFYGKYPTEKDFPKLKKYIQHILYATNGVCCVLRNCNCNDNLSYFNPTLNIVNYLDIPEWDNSEDIYIPLFDESKKILTR